jgi:hypothetical protein
MTSGGFGGGGREGLADLGVEHGAGRLADAAAVARDRHDRSVLLRDALDP